MAGCSRKWSLPLAAVVAASALLPIRTSTAGVADPGKDALLRQSRALIEQDQALALASLGRSEEAFEHNRIAVGLDPWLRAPWIGLAARALETGAHERAAHFASVAAAIAPNEELARQLLERAKADLPADESSRRAADFDCEARPVHPDTGGLQVATRRECLERRAGLFAGTAESAAGALNDLSRLDLDEGKPESASMMLTLAGAVGKADPALLLRALVLSGHACVAVRRGVADPSAEASCAAIQKSRAAVERDLQRDLAGLSTADRDVALGRIEGLLGAGLEPADVVRRWRIDRRRGQRPLFELDPMMLRPGEEWYESHDPDAGSETILKRRPGDSAMAMFTVRADGAGAEAALRRLLGPRRPGALAWTAAAVGSTDPVQVRTSPLSLDADGGGRAEGFVWLAESASSPGVALVIVAFPGTGGLGAEGVDQSRAEIQEAMAEAILIPTRWARAAVLGPDAEFPVPVAGGRTAPGDEQSMPWRTYPAGEFTVSLPPGLVAAPPAGAPARSVSQGASASLWFRGRFKDRDGTDVAVGDDTRAGTLHVTTVKDANEARARVLGPGASGPPISDRGAVLLSSLDMTRTLALETGASAVSIARFRPTAPGLEWLVCRLAYETRVVEIDVPAVSGAASIALYWIPATVRPVHGPPPPPPVDLSGRLGISFLRPAPSERTESFYKEGDLRSREFTMIVARGYGVVLDTVSPDAFPVRLTHADGEAIVRLEKLPREASAVTLDPASLQERLASSVQSWLARESFELEGRLVRGEPVKLSRVGASAGLDATFSAVSEGSGDASRPSPRRRAAGRAMLLQSREGEAFVFLSLFWDADAAHRTEEIDLMSGSLRLMRTKPGAGAGGPGPSRGGASGSR